MAGERGRSLENLQKPPKRRRAGEASNYRGNGRMPSSSQHRNHLIAALPLEGCALLRPHLERVDFESRQILEKPDRRIRHAYFIERGLVSINAIGARRLEVAVVGCEGMIGVAAVLGSDRSPLEALVRVEGDGFRVDVDELKSAMEKSRALRQILLNYAHGFMLQTAHTALCYGTSKVEERVARWLLLADDRLDNNEIPLTHQALSEILGVRRASVTVALQQLEQRRLIFLGRSKIFVSDRNGLERSANGAYEAQVQKGGALSLDRSRTITSNGGHLRRQRVLHKRVSLS
jgi:CRP-like cAMP-binding protein